MSNEAKFFGWLGIVFVVILIAVYAFNYKDWDAQRARKNACASNGGIYLVTTQIEGCFTMNNLTEATEASN